MSGSLAYGVGVGGRIDHHLKLDSLKEQAAPLFKRNTYTDPLKRLSWPRSKSRSNSQSTDQQDNTPTMDTSDATPSTEPSSTSPATTDSPSTMPPTDKASISYHSLDTTSPAPQVAAILSLSNTIFSVPAHKTTHFSSLSTWHTHLLDPNSIILFATVPSTQSNVDVEPIAFIYAYPRCPSEFPPELALKTPVMHIWLAGVLPQYRGSGVFGELMRQAEEFTRERGMQRMSVATFPEKFGKMYEILVRKGWVVEEKMEEGKVLMIKNVDDGYVTTEEEIGVAK